MKLILVLPALLSTVGAILLPNPDGPYPVARRVHTLTDTSRNDPYAPANKTEKRRVLVSLFWPVDGTKACKTETVPYMPPATAELYGMQASSMGLSNETYASFSMEYCKVAPIRGCSAKSKKSQYPLAVFSSGAGNSRLIYSATAKSLASNGYVVVLVDHTYDAAIVEFPNGDIVLAADIPETDPSLEEATKVRSEDISFVISQFEDPSSRYKLTKGLPGAIDLTKVVALGHSLGGASAAETILNDKRVLGGIDMDGRLFNPVLSKGLDKPFMLLGRPNHRSEDKTWAQFYDNLRGSKAELQIAGTLHGSFTDTPILITALDLPEEYKKPVESLVGTVEGKKMQSLLSKTLDGFFTYVFDGKTEALTKTIKGSKELSVVNSNIV